MMRCFCNPGSYSTNCADCRGYTIRCFNCS
uniref:Uncharacterized protein n=1 Tax=Arundo donax TaxID=35708 RepID=A0A0A8Z452_ARUDO